MLYEFKVIKDLYDEPDEAGESKLIKKGIITKQLLELDELSISEVINNYGRIYKNRCLIQHRDLGQIMVMHKYNDIKELKQPIIVKGFRQ